MGLVCLPSGQCSCQVGLYTAETDMRGYPVKCSPERIRPISAHNPSSSNIHHTNPYNRSPPPDQASPSRGGSPSRGSPSRGTSTRGLPSRGNSNRGGPRDENRIQNVSQPSPTYDKPHTNQPNTPDSRAVTHHQASGVPNASSSSYNPNPPKVRPFNPDPSQPPPPYRPVYPADEYSVHSHSNPQEYIPQSTSNNASPMYGPPPSVPPSHNDINQVNPQPRPNFPVRPNPPPHTYSSYPPQTYQRNTPPPPGAYNDGYPQNESHRHTDMHSHAPTYTSSENDRRRSTKPSRRGPPNTYSQNIPTEVHVRPPMPQQSHIHTPPQMQDVTYPSNYVPQYEEIPIVHAQGSAHAHSTPNVATSKRRNSGDTNSLRRRY